MVGVWHASDCVGSGYSELYVFYETAHLSIMKTGWTAKTD